PADQAHPTAARPNHTRAATPADPPPTTESTPSTVPPYPDAAATTPDRRFAPRRPSQRRHPTCAAPNAAHESVQPAAPTPAQYATSPSDPEQHAAPDTPHSENPVDP